MKVKVISRSEAAHTRESKMHAFKGHKNMDPNLHHFETAIEVRRQSRFARVSLVTCLCAVQTRSKRCKN